MTARRLHRAAGIVMLLPLLAWAATGALFFIKPGYVGAYDIVSVRTYPLDTAVAFRSSAWLEARVLRTILGHHLLARTAEGWQHLDAEGQDRPVPSPDEVRRLLDDAIAGKARYGRVTSVAGLEAVTDTGVRLTLDWHRLSIAQRGADTDRIDALYRVHYLQWTGIAVFDRVLGVAGLILLVTLSILGARLWWGSRRGSRESRPRIPRRRPPPSPPFSSSQSR
jgi:uncharacterized iron-regulated membrane protein